MMNLKEFIQSDHIQNPHFVLFGNPVGHSLSPLMHNTAADYYGIDVQYYAVQLQEDEINLIDDFLQNNQLKGVNLTIPFKYDFIKYCQALDPVSSKIKAVNVLVKNRKGWKGYNTDAYGFSFPLKQFEQQLIHKEAIIFGSGGAAKAVSYALNKIGVSKIIVVSRNPAQVNDSVIELADVIISYNQWPQHAPKAKLIVNTTPLGMAPHKGESPVKQSLEEHLSKKICYDLIYNPAETRFLKQAKQNGAVTLNGLDMLIHQGSKIFEWWTGNPFPVSKVKNKLQKEFDG